MDKSNRTMRRSLLAVLLILLVCKSSETASAQEKKQASSPKVTAAEWQGVVDKAVGYLRSQGQASDGSYSKQNGIGVTALVTAGLLASQVSPEDPVVAKSINFLLQYRQKDGGIYQPDSKHTNYETCLVMMALSKANRGGKYNEVLSQAASYVKRLQWDETEEKNKEDMTYGGAGYGSKSRPDLSNTSFMIEALKSVGTSESDEAIQRALIFINRCQNLESPANTTPFAGLVKDGGFYYTPAAGGESQAGKDPNGGLRSYASMTYAGLKSMIFAGVAKDDPRIKAAVKFLQSHYALDSNPGMGSSGLFYYYHTMAKALDVLGSEEFEAADGKHLWKQELFHA